MARETSVVVENLVKRFGDFTAVDNISFEVEKGEIFGFLGPNGAGKSTTIRILCGLITPTSGRALVKGYDVARDALRIKDNIGYMSQRFSLYDDLKVLENISFFGGIYGLSGPRLKDRIDFVLNFTGLTEQKNNITGTLASGWKQRLALGCAILHEPPVVFLDEPTSGVDPLSRRRFWDLIYLMSSEGVTVFVTTHYMDEAEYCDRLALIYRGRLIALGRSQELKSKFMAETILEASCEPLIQALEALQTNPGYEAAIFGDTLHVRIKDAVRDSEAVRQRLAEHNVNLRSIRVIPPSLEDVFVTLIEKEEQTVGHEPY